MHRNRTKTHQAWYSAENNLQVLSIAFARHDWEMMAFLIENGWRMEDNEEFWQRILAKADWDLDSVVSRRLRSYGLRAFPDDELLTSGLAFVDVDDYDPEREREREREREMGWPRRR